MKNSLYLFIAISCIAFQSQAQFNWDSYKPITMDSLKIIHAKLLEVDSTSNGATDVRINTKINKYKILVEYADSIQTIRDDIKFACDSWISGIIKRPERKNDYLHEVLIRSNKKEYWIPIQEVLISSLKKEISKESMFYIYVALVGSIYDDLILSINEFESAS